MTGRLWPWYSDAALDEVRDRIASGENLGQQYKDEAVLDFESLFLDRLGGQDQHVLSFNSGTSALLAGFIALGLSGKDVLVPTRTFRATVTPLQAIGARPVFYGVDPIDGAPLFETIEEELLEKSSAIVVTHVNGIVADMAHVNRLAKQYSLMVIEDCSHSHGSIRESGERVGAGADLAVFSTGTTKLVSGGLGGIALFREEAARDHAVLLGQPKWRLEYEQLPNDVLQGGGYHFRMSPIAAILANDHLRRLGRILVDKHLAVSMVIDVLAEDERFTALLPTDGLRQGLYKLNVRVDNSLAVGQVVDTLRSKGVRARHVTRPLHETWRADACGVSSSSCAGASELADRAFELDCFDLHDPDWARGVSRKLKEAMRIL